MNEGKKIITASSIGRNGVKITKMYWGAAQERKGVAFLEKIP
jgi:hypothetical protein